MRRVALPVLSRRRRARLHAFWQNHETFLGSLLVHAPLCAYLLRGLRQDTKVASRDTQNYNTAIEDGLTQRLAFAVRQVEGAVQCEPYERPRCQAVFGE